jgi:hypothetical protein
MPGGVAGVAAIIVAPLCRLQSLQVTDLIMDSSGMLNHITLARTLILFVAVTFSGCSGLSLASGRLELDDLASLRPSRTSYDDVIVRCGQPLREVHTDGEIRATYAFEQEAASLSNIDGKGFVRGVGGFVSTYPMGQGEVTLVFDAKTRLYKTRQWQSTKALQVPLTTPN